MRPYQWKAWYIYAAGGVSKPTTRFIKNKVEFKEYRGVIVDGGIDIPEKGFNVIGDICKPIKTSLLL